MVLDSAGSIKKGWRCGRTFETPPAMSSAETVRRRATAVSPRWVVLNQTQSPAFQHLVERLTAPLGDALLVTGRAIRRNAEQGSGSSSARPTAAPGCCGALRPSCCFTGKAFLETVRLEGGAVFCSCMHLTDPPLVPHLA